ncbi:MAG TPA: serine hydrolase [Casimicrobiaceae bacterium]|nr:serine hydrolase [Casimicrobiaceae bacterium]
MPRLAGAAAHGTDAFPGAAAAYVVRVDGAPLWEADADRPLPPASLTKLMTALLVAAHGDERDEVAISARAARAGGARLGVAAGQRFRVGDLLAALLLRSANDACVALAEHVAGSERAFVAQMNERARAMGLARTRFANACGFDAPGHVSSAADLARLAEAFLAVPALARWAAAEKHAFEDAGRTRRYAVASTNALLGRVEGVRGVKTGFTNRAGLCLVGYAERDGHRVLVVLLRARDRWWDAVAMIEQAFARAGEKR